MHCEKFKSRLNVVLDERLNPRREPSLRAHARRCSECADLLEMHTELLSAVRELPSVSPRADFSFRVMAAFEASTAPAAQPVTPTPNVSTPRRVSRSSSKWFAGLLAAAAAVGFTMVSWNGTGPASGIDADAPTVVHVNPGSVGVIPATMADNLDLQKALISDLTEGIKPVTSSVYTALQKVWRTLPASELAHVLL
jgi:hypothetical protein